MGQIEASELSGTRVAEHMEQHISTRTALLEEYGLRPSLDIISDNYTEGSPTQKYIDLKIKVGSKLGVMATSIVKEDIQDLTDQIIYSNEDLDTNGIVVQLPLVGLQDKNREERAEITDGIVNTIKPRKDVDGLGQYAHYDPATPKGIINLFESNNIDYINEPVLVRGLGKLVVAPLVKLLEEKGAKEIYPIDINTPKAEAIRLLNGINIIVTATGQAGSLKPDLFDDASSYKFIIDAGTAEQNGKIAGDVSDSLREWGAERKWRFTPKKGASGRLTILNLLSNVTAAAEKSAGLA